MIITPEALWLDLHSQDDQKVKLLQKYSKITFQSDSWKIYFLPVIPQICCNFGHLVIWFYKLQVGHFLSRLLPVNQAVEKHASFLVAARKIEQD